MMPLLLSPLHAQTDPAKIIRVACVGDSITVGVGTDNAAFESYPNQLRRMLDDTWEVRSFGVSGTTLLKEGDAPYQKTGEFQGALQYQPQVVVIMLGTNDSKPQNWRLKDQFVADYKNLIDQFKALPTHPRIFLCRPPYVPGSGNYGINEPVVQEEIPLIDEIAVDEGADVIDTHGALRGHDAMLPDRVHPNKDGANLLARAIYQSLTGVEFTGEMARGLRSQWMGYERLDFFVAGHSCLLIVPNTPAPGNPWIWRMEFFGVEPQTELALLGKGYYVAYMDMQNLYGAPVALDLMDQFYDDLRTHNNLVSKVVLEGFSRGGLFALNWAARNPDKVASMYLDAPVCDFKSWPAGKGKGQGSPEDWKRLRKVYGLTEEQALAYTLNPVDNLAPLAAVKIPIVSVCGDADRTVPFEENTKLVEERYEALGGEIKVIVKHGGDHHPHSLKNPTPIVDFIVSHAATP